MRHHVRPAVSANRVCLSRSTARHALAPDAWKPTDELNSKRPRRPGICSRRPRRGPSPDAPQAGVCSSGRRDWQSEWATSWPSVRCSRETYDRPTGAPGRGRGEASAAQCMAWVAQAHWRRLQTCRTKKTVSDVFMFHCFITFPEFSHSCQQMTCS